MESFFCMVRPYLIQNIHFILKFHKRPCIVDVLNCSICKVTLVECRWSCYFRNGRVAHTCNLAPLHMFYDSKCQQINFLQCLLVCYYFQVEHDVPSPQSSRSILKIVFISFIISVSPFLCIYFFLFLFIYCSCLLYCFYNSFNRFWPMEIIFCTFVLNGTGNDEPMSRSGWFILLLYLVLPTIPIGNACTKSRSSWWFSTFHFIPWYCHWLWWTLILTSVEISSVW